MGLSDGSHLASSSEVLKLSFYVAEQHVSLIKQIADKNIGPAVIIVVLEVDSHPRECLSILVKGCADRKAHFFERPISTVMEDLLRRRVVGDDNIRPPIQIKIVDRYTQTFPRRKNQTGLGCHIGESAIAIVVEDERR